MASVVIADGSLHPYHDFSYEVERWAQSGIDTQLAGCRTEDDLIRSARDADVVAFWGISVPFTEAVIQELGNCKLIVRYGTGIDSVDLKAAERQKILVATPGGYCTEEVASHATALILSLARRIPFLDHHIRSGGWRADSPLTGAVQRLSEQTVGLVGFGRIARRVAANLQPMVGRIVAADPFVTAAAAQSTGVELLPLDQILGISDYVSVHTPLTADTRHLIGAPELDQMRDTAFIVNTSRGATIDEVALVEALTIGRLAGAALDVFESTPLPSESPLRRLDNVILTPHFAANSVQAKQELYEEIATIVEDVLAGAPPQAQIHAPLESASRFAET